MLPLNLGNVPMEFVNKDLGKDSHGMREEVFPPVDHRDCGPSLNCLVYCITTSFLIWHKRLEAFCSVDLEK